MAHPQNYPEKTQKLPKKMHFWGFVKYFLSFFQVNLVVGHFGSFLVISEFFRVRGFGSLSLVPFLDSVGAQGVYLIMSSEAGNEDAPPETPCTQGPFSPTKTLQPPTMDRVCAKQGWGSLDQRDRGCSKDLPTWLRGLAPCYKPSDHLGPKVQPPGSYPPAPVSLVGSSLGWRAVHGLVT